jgi:xanthine dehydrogenase accessory factor
MLVFPDGNAEGTVGGGEMESLVIREARESLADGEPRLLHYNFSDPDRGDPGVCGGEVEIYVEPLRPQPALVIFGMGHVGKALARMGKWIGFRVIAADDREAYASEDQFPEADLIFHCDLADLPILAEIDERSYIVLTTRGVDIDVAGLPSLLETKAAYLGVIGSKRRWETSAKQLRERGVSDEKLSRVHSPMGLEINAETPEEIALSILAEIVMVRRGGTGETMRHHPRALEADEG